MARIKEYKRIQNVSKAHRYLYAKYILSKKTPIEILKNTLEPSEFDWLLNNHTKLLFRQWTRIYEFDDLARAVLKVDKNRALAIKIYKVAYGLCKCAADYAFLAFCIHRTLGSKRWCKELCETAKHSIKSGFCRINMLNFIEMNILKGKELDMFLQKSLKRTKYNKKFYENMSYELRKINQEDYADKFYQKFLQLKMIEPERVRLKNYIEDDEVESTPLILSQEEYKKNAESADYFCTLNRILTDAMRAFGKRKWMYELYKLSGEKEQSIDDYAAIADIMKTKFKDHETALKILHKALNKLKEPDAEVWCAESVIKVSIKHGELEILKQACKAVIGKKYSYGLRLASCIIKGGADRNLAIDFIKSKLRSSRSIVDFLRVAYFILTEFNDKEWAIEVVLSRIDKN
ncbi:hypothetical protein [Campylobacter majalis]|uniref:hypothetical protein n=1 Tax=Campylobacter majalis TaxID=2790656 RepID=UPI003D6973E8